MWLIELKRLVRYGLVGIVNTAVGFIVIILSMGIGALPMVANALGFACGLTISLILNVRWSFGSKLDWAAGLRFMGAFGVAYTVNLLVLNTLDVTNIGPLAGQLAAVVSYQIVFFFLLRFAVFCTKASGV